MSVETITTCFLVPEGMLADELRLRSEASIRWRTRTEALRVVVTLAGDDQAIERCVAGLVERFGRARVRRGEVTAARLLFDALRSKGWMLATAESCTGGMIAAHMTSMAGSSELFWGSFVTYANAAKRQMLDVVTVEDYGAVSRETAEAMANGALRRSGADVAIAVTGIAGPGGGTPSKPVGTIFATVAASRGDVVTRRLLFVGSRTRIRGLTCVAALLMAEVYIRDMSIDNDLLRNYT